RAEMPIVLKTGDVKAGDAIEVESRAAPHRPLLPAHWSDFPGASAIAAQSLLVIAPTQFYFPEPLGSNARPRHAAGRSPLISSAHARGKQRSPFARSS